MTRSTTSTVDVWADVRSAIAGLIGQGANISLSPSTGMVTVTARPGDQDMKVNHIRDLNATTGQQISFDVNVLTVTLEGGRNHGISLDLVFNLSESVETALSKRTARARSTLVSSPETSPLVLL